MTTFTITTAKNMTELTGKTGSDTYNVNGGTLTIDCDTRYGPNTTETTGPFANISLSATLGGTATITGKNVWAMSVTGATTVGTVPAGGATITQGGVTAEFLLGMSERYGGQPLAAGTTWSAVSAGDLWCKFRNMVGGTFTTGMATLSTGETLMISSVPERSFIEVVGVEALSLNVNRLNSLTVDGDWWSPVSATYTTDGTATQEFYLPNGRDYANTFARTIEYPGVEIETAPGSGVYAHWPNAGNMFTAANLSTDSRCRYVHINSNGLVRIGHNATETCGYVPQAGCRIRIPNIITASTNATVGFGKNSTPSGTMGTRYELATNSSGAVNIQRVTGSWYWNIQQAYSVYIRDLHTCEQFVLSEPSTAPDVDGLMVGLSNQATPYASNSIVFQQCLSGGTARNLTGLRAQQVSTSGYSVYFVNLFGGWSLTNVRGGYAQDATALAGSIFFNTCENFTATNLELIGKRLIMSNCANWTVDGITYADNPKATTGSTVSTQAVELMSGCRTGVMKGMKNWPGVANVHPLGGWVYMNTCSDLLITGFGTAADPLNGGSVAAFRTGYLFSDGGINKGIKLQRNWFSNLRLHISSSTNTSQGIRMQNCYNVDATLSNGPQWLNSVWRANRCNAGTVQTTYTHVDGMHFWDSFTSDTTTRAAIIFTEKTPTSGSAYTIDSGTPKFTSTGSCVMQTVGDQVTWSMPYFMLGWTGLTTVAVTGTNIAANHLIQYDVDKGAGYTGTFKTLTNANLAAETGISPTTGVKFKVRIACTVAATTNVLTSLVINGTTTLALQNAALYPLDVVGLTINGIQPGSDVVVYEAGTTNVLDTGDSVGATSYTYGYDTLRLVDIGVLLSGYRPYYIRNYQLTSVSASLPVAQEFDRTYL